MRSDDAAGCMTYEVMLSLQGRLRDRCDEAVTSTSERRGPPHVRPDRTGPDVSAIMSATHETLPSTVHTPRTGAGIYSLFNSH